MKVLKIKAMALAAMAVCSLPLMAEVPEGYELVWSDEFDTGTQLDATKWQWEDWAARHVNNELQTYKPGTETIDGRHTTELRDGALAINLFKGSDGKYYSGRINAQSGSSANGWRYGYIEARIRLPKGKGTWPAFWMMPSGVDWTSETWPTCGEIDIMEEVGVDPNITSSSLHAIGHNHTNGTQVTAARYCEGAEDDYHIYAIEWKNSRITTYVDGQVLLNYTNDHKGYVNWPYDKPYYVILNLAWGGDWGGYAGTDDSALPTDMLVDYVRVYQQKLPEMEADGSGAAYIMGPYRIVGIDGFVPSSSYTSWDQNVIPMTTEGKKHSFTFTMDKNLRISGAVFRFYPVPRHDNSVAFKASEGTYHVTMPENPYFYVDTEQDGAIKLKEGAPVVPGDLLTVTLDCTEGTDKAVATVEYSPAPPVEPTEGIWIIGALGSVGETSYNAGDMSWDPNRNIEMDKDGDVFTHTFVCGQTLNPDQVNFKFFGQPGWGLEFCDNNSDYLITSQSPIFGIGTGSDGHDNGNVYLRPGETLKNGDVVNVKVDCTAGYNKAVLTTSGTYTSSVELTPAESCCSKAIYTLDGLPVESVERDGIYIVNGEKMYLKK